MNYRSAFARVLSSFFFCAVTFSASASVIVVNTFADFGGDSAPGDGICAFVPSGGQCTLRAAIMEANALAGADTILLPSGTYTLALAGSGEDSGATGDLDITSDLTIIGSGGNEAGSRSATTVEAGSLTKGGIDRVFHINPNGSGSANVTIKALTIRNGSAPGSADVGYGGGLSFETTGATSSLTLFNVAVVDNKTAGQTNYQGGAGGGLDLYNFSAATGIANVLIEKSLISNNETTVQDGGGISAVGVNLTIRDSEVSDNFANWPLGSATGGGLLAADAGTQVTIERSLFVNNMTSTPGYGGGVGARQSAVVSVKDSTFSGNHAGSRGGAFHITGAATALALTNVTVTGNTAATGDGGGLSVSSGTATLTNTIVYGNTALTSSDIDGSVAPSSSYNVTGSASGGLTNGINGNQIGVNPLLGALADNGGPTRTHKLLNGSPAIEAGTNSGTSSLDQRGFARKADSADSDATAIADIGAYEAHPTISDITNKSGTAGTPLAVPFYVGDAAQALTITAGSSNQSVVPNANLVLSNTGTHNPTLTITGAGAGTATITVTVINAGMSVSDTFDVTMTGGADLTITKTHAGTFRQGLTGSYTITVTNVGTIATNGSAVTVTDTLPAELTASAMSGTGWTCNIGTLTCTRADVLSAGSSFPSIILAVDIVGSGNRTNVANVAGGGDTNGANNSASDAAFLVPASELEVTLTGPATVVPGESSSHTIVVRNLGPSSTSGTITLSGNATAGTTYTGASGTNWNCVWTTSSISCTRSNTLSVNASTSITVPFTVNSSAPAQVTFTAGAIVPNDVKRTKNTDSLTIDVVRAPDVTITKSHAGDFREGGTGDYTLTVTNSGFAPTSDVVTVTDTLPAGLTPTAMSGAGWTCDLATLTCTTADVLAAGASFSPITLTVAVDADAQPSLVNLANVSGGGEIATGNNEAIDPTTITQVADLVPFAAEAGGAFAQGDNGRSYEVYVENIGDAVNDSAVTMAMSLSPGLSFNSVTPRAGWTCTEAPLVCSTSDPISPGAGPFLVATVSVDVAVDAPASVSLTATVSGGGEVVTSNNVFTDTTNVIQMPDLVVAKTHAGDFTQGGVATYTIRVSNEGSGSPSSNVFVDEVPPSELAVTAISGSGWNCDLMALRCFRADPLAPGESYSDIIVTGTVDVAAPTTITNTAIVSGPDRDSSNNTATDVANVLPPADLTIVKTAPAALYAGQVGAQYVITVSNIGAVPTAGEVVVTELPPAGLTVTSMSGSGWTCDTSTCRRSDALNPSTAWDPITVFVDVAEAAAGTITNSATVSGGGELRVDNDSASAAADVQFLTFTPTPLPDGLVGIAYDQSIGVSGSGIAPYAFTIVSGALPAGISLAADGRISGVPTAGGTFTFTIQANDSASAPATFAVRKTWTLTIAPPSINVFPETVPNAAFNTPYTTTLSATGGTAPYQFSVVSGALPAGLTLAANGVLAGTATEVGVFTFTVSATDSSSGTGPYSGSRAYVFAATKSEAIVSVSAPQVAFGSDGTVIVTVSSPAGTTPTGTVSMWIDGVPAGTQDLASGTATFTLPSPAVGWYPLYVAYSGDATHGSAAGVAVLSVTKANPVITIDAPSIAYGDAATVTVTIPNATGNVDITVGEFAQTQPLVGGVATFTFNGVGAGWQMTFATYAGDGNVYSGMKSTYLFVEKATTSTSVAAPAIDYGTDATITVNVSSAAGSPDGSIALSLDGAAPLSAVLAGGSATFTIPSLTAGDHTLVATYAGADDYTASSANATIHVNQVATSLTIDAPSIEYGSDASITVTVSSNGGEPTGNVALSVDGGATLNATLAGGAASVTIPGLIAGDHSLAITYSGADDYAASSADGTIHVDQAASSLTIVAPSIVFGGDAVITVTATSVETPTGEITLTINGADQMQPLVAGVATFTLSSPGAGNYALTASWSGDANMSASSADATLTVAQAPTSVTITSTSPSPSIIGDRVAISFSVSDGPGDVTIAAAAYSCTAAASAGSCTITFDAVGSYDLVATYAGDANYAPSTSAPFTHVVEHPIGDAVVSGDATICAGDEVTLVVELTGTAPWTLTWSDGFVETVSSAMHQRSVRVDTTTVYTLTSATDANRAMTVAGSAQITVRAPLDAPQIDGVSEVVLGESFTLFASREYDSYQWYRNGRIIGGEISRTLRIASATARDLASYTVIGLVDGCVSPQSRAFRVSEVAAGPEHETLVATIVGSADGVNGSRFRSAMHLFNRGADPLDAELSFVTPGFGKTALSTALALMPQETRWYGDIFAGEGLASADLVVRDGATPFGLVHVYNQLVENGEERGTTGLLQPLVDQRRALVRGDRAVLIAPADPVATRLNIGVRTLRDGASMRITVRSASGEVRSTFDQSFPPSYFSHVSAAQFLAVAPAASDSIVIEMLDGSAIVYGASTDNVTNDPNIQFAQRIGSAADARRVIPVVGSTAGAFDSRFRTAVQLYNADVQPQSATFMFHPGAVSKSFEIAPHATLAIDDLLPAMDLAGLGTADLVAPSSVVSVVRVFNDGEGETSMTEDSVSEADVLAAGAVATTLAPHEPSKSRFNIGIRTLEEGATIVATVRSPQGVVLATRELAFGPTHFQHTSALDVTGHVFTGDESVTWEVKNGRAVIYGVWTDNITNDPSFHYAQ